MASVPVVRCPPPADGNDCRHHGRRRHRPVGATKSHRRLHVNQRHEREQWKPRRCDVARTGRDRPAWYPSGTTGAEARCRRPRIGGRGGVDGDCDVGSHAIAGGGHRTTGTDAMTDTYPSDYPNAVLQRDTNPSSWTAKFSGASTGSPTRSACPTSLDRRPAERLHASATVSRPED